MELMKNGICFFSPVIASYCGVVEAVVLQYLATKPNRVNKEIMKKDLYYLQPQQLTKSINKLKELDLVRGKMTKTDVIFTINVEELESVVKVEEERVVEVKEMLDDDAVVVKHSYDSKFESVWQAYNKDKENRGSKTKAYDKWKKSKFSKLPIEVIEKIVRFYRATSKDVKFMKHFQNFITNEDYESFAPETVWMIDKKNIKRLSYLFDDNEIFLVQGDEVTKAIIPREKINKMKKEGRIVYNKT